MRYVADRRIKLLPDIQTLAGRLGVIILAMLLTSCGSSGDAPQQPSPPTGNDASLSSLAISDGTLSPAFAPSVTDYAASVLHSTDNIVVSATRRDSDASLMINGGAETSVPLIVGDNTISVVVTAEDGTTTRTYTIIVTRAASDNANLSGLELSNATFEPAFDRDVFDYAATVGLFTESTQITATAEGENAVISVNGTEVTSGVTTEPIALSEGGNTILVKVTAADGFATRSYTIVVTRQSELDYFQKAYVKAPDPDPNDAFGARVALSGDGMRLIVGAPFTIPGLTDFCGEDPWLGKPQSIYEYERGANGMWGELPIIVGFEAPGQIADVELSGNGSTLAVSAGNLGLYVFGRDSGGTWTQQELDLQTPLSPYFDFRSVAISSDGATLAVVVRYALEPLPGEPFDAVYVFAIDSGGVWTQQLEIADGKYPTDCCGFVRGVALSGNGATLAMGVLGGVYVFGRDSSNAWTERAHLRQFSNDSEDYFFGESIALSLDGTMLAVGDTSAEAAYLFRNDSGNAWMEETFLRQRIRSDDQFGKSVALSADGAMLAVGAPNEDSATTGVNGDETDNSAEDTGATYVFTRDSFGAWTQRAYLKASTSSYTKYFGFEVALSDDGTTVAVGVPGDYRAACFSGAAYIFLH